MEDDSSNDVITMESVKSEMSSPQVERNMELTDRPLMQFFKRLILNKHSQNTMLTNAQLEDILNGEFNFDLRKLHVLEVNIYVTILKKYLKEWPSWDEFETITKDLTVNYDQDAFVNILEKTYKNLHCYLQENLEMAKNLSAELITKVKEGGKKSDVSSVAEEPKSSDPNSVVLEIAATRDQLNKLIYRQPHAGFNNTIFNIEDKILPSHIKLNTLSLEAILNWWSVRITISLQSNNVFLTRETAHELQHSLVNRHRKDKEKLGSPLITLNEDIQIKETKKVKRIPSKQLVGCLDLLSTKHDLEMEGMETIIQFVKRDLGCFPVAAAPAHYRRYLNKYPYVRYLYSESVKKADNVKYDIQLKETISPMHHFSIGRFEGNLLKCLPPQWLKVECVKCNVSCSGENLATELRQHFDEFHQEEPDWHCTNCQKIFPMAQLAESWWSHKCNE